MEVIVMKKWNQKSKAEQIFILCLIFVGAFGLLCVTGCDGCSCETVKCGSEEWDGVEAKGISIPGCGGCITYERGCDSCLWAQSVKFVCANYDEEGEDMHDNEYEFKGNFSACDTRYYDGGCMGCDQSEENCYVGCTGYTHDSTDNKKDVVSSGCFYSSCDGSGKVVGCVNGCVMCGDDSSFEYDLQDIESDLGID